MASTPSDSSSSVLKCVRDAAGEIWSLATKLQQDLHANPGSHPFDEIFYLRAGNPQSLGQQPITFFREVPYYLDEATGWGLEISELSKQLGAARSEGINVRALVVINPGNPTGQVLSEENQRDMVKFCMQESLVLMADEAIMGSVEDEEVIRRSLDFLLM